MDSETERFLWRRKADLEGALRILDNMEEAEESKNATSSIVKDIAKVSNMTANELKQRSKGGISNAQQKSNKGTKTVKDQSPKVPEDTDVDATHLKAFLIGIDFQCNCLEYM